jgi:secreted trypsin-like serine protease
MNKLLSVCVAFALVTLSACTKEDSGGAGVCGAIGAKVWGGDSCNTGARSSAVLIFGLAKDGAQEKAVSVCSGALISSTHVLTAGHCIKGLEEAVVKRGMDFVGWTVYVGGKKGEEVRVAQAKSHPEFSGMAGDRNDVGVLTLQRSPRPAVAPLPLLLSEDVKIGAELTAYGFGKGENQDKDIGTLKALQFKVSGFLRDNLFVEGDGESSICQGDSGGPVVADNNKGKPAIVAVSSFGDAKGCVSSAASAYGFASVQLKANFDFIVAAAPEARVD